MTLTPEPEAGAMLTAAPAFPPSSYKRLSGMLRRGQGYRAPGPCAIPGCTYAARGELDAARYGWEWDKPRSPPFVWDHCHTHDYVRGILCRDHNRRIAPIDNQDHYRLRRYRDLPELLAYRERCPACALSSPWQPVMVRHSPALVHRTAHLAERESTRSGSQVAGAGAFACQWTSGASEHDRYRGGASRHGPV